MCLIILYKIWFHFKEKCDMLVTDFMIHVAGITFKGFLWKAAVSYVSPCCSAFYNAASFYYAKRVKMPCVCICVCVRVCACSSDWQLSALINVTGLCAGEKGRERELPFQLSATYNAESKIERRDHESSERGTEGQRNWGILSPIHQKHF